MSTINHEAIVRHLTRERLRSYLATTSGDLEHALALYDWNAQVGGVLHEDIGRLEVVFRNAIDEALVAYGKAQGWRWSGTGVASCSLAGNTVPERSLTSRWPAIGRPVEGCPRSTARSSPN
jgi:hypothetical protein